MANKTFFALGSTGFMRRGMRIGWLKFIFMIDFM